MSSKPKDFRPDAPSMLNMQVQQKVLQSVKATVSVNLIEHTAESGAVLGAKVSVNVDGAMFEKGESVQGLAEAHSLLIAGVNAIAAQIVARAKAGDKKDIPEILRASSIPNLRVN